MNSNTPEICLQCENTHIYHAAITTDGRCLYGIIRSVCAESGVYTDLGELVADSVIKAIKSAHWTIQGWETENLAE